MIVRDEAHVIERCLTSVADIARAFCIVDTGSSDGTPELAERILAGRHGVVHRRPWVDFATNRTEALRLADGWGTHALVIDADDHLVIDPQYDRGHILAQVMAPVHHVDIEHRGPDGRTFLYQRPMIVATGAGFGYRGVVHEFLDVPAEMTPGETIKGMRVVYGGDGARSRSGDKFERDAETLQRALSDGTDPDLRPRYLMYLGTSWSAAGRPWRALLAFEQRVRLGGWVQEVYCALLYAGDVRALLLRPAAEVIEAYERAESLLPQRAEAPYRLGMALRSLGLIPEAVKAFERASQAVDSPGALFLEPDIHRFQALLELVRTAVSVGDEGTAARALDALRQRPSTPNRVLEEAQDLLGR